jgi:hypothetical protein
LCRWARETRCFHAILKVSQHGGDVFCRIHFPSATSVKVFSSDWTIKEDERPGHQRPSSACSTVCF